MYEHDDHFQGHKLVNLRSMAADFKLGLFTVVRHEFKPLAALVNSQLVCLQPVEILNFVKSTVDFFVCLFQMFAWPH